MFEQDARTSMRVKVLGENPHISALRLTSRRRVKCFLRSTRHEASYLCH